MTRSCSAWTPTSAFPAPTRCTRRSFGAPCNCNCNCNCNCMLPAHCSLSGFRAQAEPGNCAHEARPVLVGFSVAMEGGGSRCPVLACRAGARVPCASVLNGLPRRYGARQAYAPHADCSVGDDIEDTVGLNVPLNKRVRQHLPLCPQLLMQPGRSPLKQPRPRVALPSGGSATRRWPRRFSTWMTRSAAAAARDSRISTSACGPRRASSSRSRTSTR